MKFKSPRSEQGQVLILVVLALVGLLGFVALAIDGGMVYSDRRHAQNASDASSLAGGGAAALSLENSFMTYLEWDCNDSRITDAEQVAISAAISRAGDNDYSIDENIDDHHGVTNVCGEQDYISWVDKYIDVRTLISSTTKTSFVHFVFGGHLINNVEAVTRVRPRTSLGYGHAIVALNEDECQGSQNGAVFSGSADIDIEGGGVFSNGCLYGNGAAFTVDVDPGDVSVAGTMDGTLDNINPAPANVPLKLPASYLNIPTPDCSGPLQGQSTSAGQIFPGTYTRIFLPNGELNMSPGLYCITGSPNAFRILGGKVSGDGVTIYVQNGNVNVSGNADLSDPGLKAPMRGFETQGAIPGVLFYLADGNSGTINLEGNSESIFLGTAYAPDGDINVSGATGMEPTFHTQLVGYNVEVGGNVHIDITFNDSENYGVPAMLELFK